MKRWPPFRRVGGVLVVVISLTVCPAVQAVSSLVPVRVSVPVINDGRPFNVARTLLLPRGWHAEVWARVADVRFAALAPSGALLVSVPAAGQVVQLSIGATQATPPHQRVVLSGLVEPQGIAFRGRTLWVAEANQLDRYLWPSLRRVAAVRLAGFGTRGVAIDRNGVVYVGGGGSLIVAGGRTIARGIRNAEGLAVDPDGHLWAGLNAAVGGSDELVELSGGRVVAHRLLGRHRVPLGLTFTPAGAYLALHGSSGVLPAVPPELVWFPWRAHRLTSPVPLASGFSRNWGSPAAIVPGPDGFLYVTDDTAGAIYRLSPP